MERGRETVETPSAAILGSQIPIVEPGYLGVNVGVSLGLEQLLNLLPLWFEIVLNCHDTK